MFLLVTFTPGNVSACVAPGCRSFRARRGHFVNARAHIKRLGLDGNSGLPAGTPRAPSYATNKAANGGRPRVLLDKDEDEGVEQMPPDTTRGGIDVDVKSLSDQDPRNMLPWDGEILQGEAWCRTADWRSMYLQRASGADDSKDEDLPLLRRGMMVDVANVLEQSHCSCGMMRQDRHKVKTDPAALCTHHSTAPPRKVCSPECNDV